MVQLTRLLETRRAEHMRGGLPYGGMPCKKRPQPHSMRAASTLFIRHSARRRGCEECISPSREPRRHFRLTWA